MHCYANCHSIELGVLQGSILGPLFYNIYTNDINFLFDNTKPILYADDTTLVFLSNDIKALTVTVNAALIKLTDWCNYNRLVINRNKTKCMLVTPRLNVAVPSIYLGETQLEFVDSFKYLGVYLDSDLKFGEHIRFLTGQVSRLCGTAYRLSGLFNLSSARSFYYAYFYSITSYNICIWGGVLTCTQRASGLIRLQRKIVKCLFSRFFNAESTDHLFNLTGILRLNHVYLLKAATLMYKVIKLNKYPTLRDDLELRYNTHHHGTRFNDTYRLPFPRTETIRFSFKYQLIKIWNSIPSDITDEQSLTRFKKRFTEHLLSN